MKITIFLAQLCIAAVAAFLLWRYVYEPWHCDLVYARAEKRTREAFSSRYSDDVAHIMARSTLEEVAPCLARDPSNVAIYMLQAANYRVLGRREEAIQAYQRALQYDRRPEIFLNLGLVQLELNRRPEALKSFELALRFDPHIESEIRNVDLFAADEAVRRVRRHRLN